MRTILLFFTLLGLKAGTRVVVFLSKIFMPIIKKTDLHKVTISNIKIAFSERNHSFHSNLANESICNSLASFYETLYVWSRGPETSEQHIKKIKNRYLFDFNRQQPQLLFSFHNRSIDFLLSWIITKKPCFTMYTKFKNRFINDYVVKFRSFNHSSPVEANLSGVKKMLIHLKENGTVNIAADQVPKDGLGQYSTFFGQKCYSTNIVSTLSKRININPTLIFLSKGEVGYEIVFKSTSSDILGVDGANIMHQIFEHEILNKPEEYAWEYKKYRKVKENSNIYK